MERKIYKIPELSASDKRNLDIRKLYNTIDTLKRNELPSKESSKMVRQLSNEDWKQQMRDAVTKLNRKLEADGAMERLSDNAHLSVTLGSASLRDVARELYGKNKLAKGGMKKKRNANIDYRKSGMFYVGGMSAKPTKINKGKK